jgi:hypothetical protein
MSFKDITEKTSSAATSHIGRRDFLLAVGTTATLGFDVTLASAGTAATNSSATRIDAYTRFSPLKFIDFVEKAEGRPFVLRMLLMGRPALTDVSSRIDQLDRNAIDVNVLVPVPWIEAFPKVYNDPVVGCATWPSASNSCPIQNAHARSRSYS